MPVADREYLLGKLNRVPKLASEVLRPGDKHQRRISRLFWQLEHADPQWLAGVLGDLADRTEITNKAAWFNRAVTARVKMLP